MPAIVPSPWPAIAPLKYHHLNEEVPVAVNGVLIWTHWCYPRKRYEELPLKDECKACGAPDKDIGI